MCAPSLSSQVAGALLATNITVSSLGGFIAPILGSWLYDKVGMPDLCTGLGFFIIGVYIPAGILLARYHETPDCFKKSPPETEGTKVS